LLWRTSYVVIRRFAPGKVAARLSCTATFISQFRKATISDNGKQWPGNGPWGRYPVVVGQSLLFDRNNASGCMDEDAAAALPGKSRAASCRPRHLTGDGPMPLRLRCGRLARPGPVRPPIVATDDRKKAPTPLIPPSLRPTSRTPRGAEDPA